MHKGRARREKKERQRAGLGSDNKSFESGYQRSRLEWRRQSLRLDWIQVGLRNRHYEKAASSI